VERAMTDLREFGPTIFTLDHPGLRLQSFHQSRHGRRCPNRQDILDGKICGRQLRVSGTARRPSTSDG
jgi:hypothetical protein